MVKRHPRLHALLNRRVERLGAATNALAAPALAAPAPERVIIIGYGPVGRTVARRVEEFGLQPLVVDANIDTVLTLQAEGKLALFGDASRATILREAGITRVRHFVVTLPDASTNQGIVRQALALNPDLNVLARARYLASGNALSEAGAATVCFDEAEAATALALVLRAHLKANASAT